MVKFPPVVETLVRVKKFSEGSDSTLATAEQD
jgi:hypothetical protein